MDAGALGPLHGHLHVRDAEPSPEVVSWPRKSRQPSVPGLATRPTCSATSGSGTDAFGAQQALGLERAQQLGPLGGQPAEDAR